MRVLDNIQIIQETNHLGGLILDKFINNIKSKIPFGKKGKEIDEDEEIEEESSDTTDPALSALDRTGATDISDMEDELEDDEDHDEPKSIVDKIKAKFAGKKKPDSKDKTKSKKKINPIVLVLVLVGLAFFVFYEEEPVVAPPVLKKIQKVAKKDIETAKPVDGDTAVKPEVEEPAIAAETPEAPSVEEPAVTETPDTPLADEPVIADTPVAPSEDDSVVTEAQTPIEEPSIGESNDTNVDDGSSIDEPVVTDIAPTSFDSVDGQVTDNDETSMTDKILEDLEKQVKKDQPAIVKTEYVAPPDYEYRGRGLVYNCAGKHWACVDGPSYKVCENNFSSTTYQKKTIECYPFNIYETKKGCELMQNRVVSSSAKTNFCKGN